jgi:hypothetical protein
MKELSDDCFAATRAGWVGFVAICDGSASKKDAADFANENLRAGYTIQRVPRKEAVAGFNAYADEKVKRLKTVSG